MFGWEFTETDMTGFPYLLSIYPLADGKIKIFPVVNGSTDDYVNIPDVKSGEWNHLVFDFSGKDLTKVFQIGWQDYYTLNGFFVDNVYFSQLLFFIKFSFVSFLSFLYMLLVLRRFAFDIGNERCKINKNYEKIIFFCENICFFKKKVVTLRA